MVRTPKGRALGRALREAREGKRLTTRDLGEMLSRDHGVVSRWETGERTPKPEQVAQILTVLGVNGDRYDEIIALSYTPDESSWVASTLPAQRQQLSAFVDIEEKATKLIEVSPLLIPGLLQTDDYVRAVMSGGGIPAGEVATRVAIRIGRRAVLNRAKLSSFVALIGESALYQQVGGSSVMRDQLRHLIGIADHPKVELRIVPFGAGWNPALEGPFIILESEQSKPVVQLESRRSSLLLHEAIDVVAYQRAVDKVRLVAMGQHESLRIISGVLNRMERGGHGEPSGMEKI